MATPNGDDDATPRLPERLSAWVEEVTGTPVLAARRMAGGGRKQAWFVDVAGTEAMPAELFLRWDPADPAETGDPWTVRREAAVYRSLRDQPVPVARFLAVHPTEEAMLATRVTGRNWFSHITDPAEQLAVADDFIGHLASLHRIDVHELDLPGFDPDRPVADLVRDQLAEMRALVEFRGGRPEPVLQLALDWLDANIPAYDGPTVLVQGDTGPGNFMYEGGRVTAIVDWELAHLGDPMDDIAWLSLRSVQEPFTDLRARIADYRERSGHPVDAARVAYYRVLAEAKILVMNHGIALRSRAEADGGGGDVGARLIFGQLHRRLCAEALADVMGVALPAADLPADPEPGDLDDLFDIVLGQLRHVIVPRITDGFAAQRTKGMARVIKYLAVASRRGGAFEARELDDLTAGLGRSFADVREARAALADAVREGTIDPARALALLYRRIQRDNELLREASGALADRHYEPVV